MNVEFWLMITARISFVPAGAGPTHALALPLRALIGYENHFAGIRDVIGGPLHAEHHQAFAPLGLRMGYIVYMGRCPMLMLSPLWGWFLLDRFFLCAFLPLYLSAVAKPGRVPFFWH